MTLEPEHFPATVRCADSSSTTAQSRFLGATAAILALGVLAATMGAVQEEWAGWVGAVAFTLSLVTGALAIHRTFERTWYDGRALAESGKSLTWQFAARAGPYGAALDMTEARNALREHLQDLRTELERLDFKLDIQGPEVGVELERLREASLPQRRNAYRSGRLEDQLQWYRARSLEHARYANILRGLALLFQAAGIGGALAKGLGWTDIDLLGIGAAGAIALTAWVQTRDHAVIARAYAITAQDLEFTLEDEAMVPDQSRWEAFVSEAESAISREHVMWLARRGRHH